MDQRPTLTVSEVELYPAFGWIILGGDLIFTPYEKLARGALESMADGETLLSDIQGGEPGAGLVRNRINEFDKLSCDSGASAVVRLDLLELRFR